MTNMPLRLMILGGTGMLGHTLFRYLSAQDNLDVYATARSAAGLDRWFAPRLIEKIRTDVDADNFDTVIRALAAVQPDIVINCIGLIKQLPLANDPLSAITINSQLPHRLSLICRAAGARMIHISTDCVFDGQKGNYRETDPSNATDLYGRSKYLGEVTYDHCVTLRTSIIGHELKGRLGLVEWFRAQSGPVLGFTKAIYTGFPTIELASVIHRFVLPDASLRGVYHVASSPISKYELLLLVARKYSKQNMIMPVDDVRIDRSLDGTRFCQATGYRPPTWPELIDRMYLHYRESAYDRFQEGAEDVQSRK